MFELFMNKIFTDLWKDTDPFQKAFSLSGESFRKVKSRHTFRIEIDGKGYFVKLHDGCGWREYFKNILQLKKPVTGADQEYHALLHLSENQVLTMTPAAYGCQGILPACRSSFLITEELTDTVSLEDFCRDWNTKPPLYPMKASLIRQIGKMTGRMHRSGLNHRDCYICHFLLKKGTETQKEPELYVIDLHRAEIRSAVPRHYLVKDLAGLWFSSMDIGLTKHDLLRFLRAYFNMPLKEIFLTQEILLKQVNRTAIRLYRKVHKKSPCVFSGKFF